MDRSVVIVAGCRTPFAKSFTDFQDLNGVDLMTQCIGTLMAASGLDPALLGHVVVGTVIPPAGLPSVAREVVFRLGLPLTIPGLTLSRACASGLTAIEAACDGIKARRFDVAIAGGVECMSDIPIPYDKDGLRVWMAAQKAAGWGARLSALARLRPRMLVPAGLSLTEASTGKTMGEHAEEMARNFGISRTAQDDYAFESHRRAHEAETAGLLSGPVAPAFAGRDRSKPIVQDNGIRRPPDRASLDKLRPAFDRKYGTITAGNASFPTDGAAAVLVMAEEVARAHGFKPLARIKASTTVAMDPAGGLLMGPPRAIARTLDDAGLTLADMAIIELHEAFAAQVLCNVQAMESPALSRAYLGRDKPLGAVAPAKLNPGGGSLAIGHPFGATGPRVVMGVAQHLVRHRAAHGIAAVCAAGAMAQAMLLEGVES